jgi:hypothetical protein
MIDADALLEKLKGTPRYFDVKHDIEEMPTAYDVEKVVEQMEELKQNFVSNAQMLSARQIDKAIEIVRSGGVE